MMRCLILLAASASAAEVVIDFESVTVLLANDKANRAEKWVEKGVTFKLAHEPSKSKGKGLVMFFEHLSNGHKGIGSATAVEAIPVRATLPRPATTVTVAFWGSTATPAVLEALDAEGKVVDSASLSTIPRRKSPSEPAPIFTMTVKAPSIAAIQFSGPRPGEFLAADELRISFAE